MNWKITTAAAAQAVTTAEAKSHLRVDTSDDDTLIASLITAATTWCEDYENRAYITQTITANLDKFSSEIILPRPPLQSVTTIKYLDAAGDQQTLSSAVYDVDIIREPGRVTLAYNQTWPTIRSIINAVEIIYKAGYGDASTNVPERARAAIKLLVGHLYENRELATPVALQQIPFTIKNLLNSRMPTA